MTKLVVEFPEFNNTEGIKFHWQNGFKIHIKDDDGVVTIVANKQGLQSLAGHLLNLAQENIPSGYHIHFDEYNSLEEGSLELVIEKHQ